jgi:hypothetical protein
MMRKLCSWTGVLLAVYNLAFSVNTAEARHRGRWYHSGWSQPVMSYGYQPGYQPTYYSQHTTAYYGVGAGYSHQGVYAPVGFTEYQQPVTYGYQTTGWTTPPHSTCAPIVNACCMPSFRTVSTVQTTTTVPMTYANTPGPPEATPGN